MNSLILGGIDYVVNTLLHWLIWGVGILADGIAHLSLMEAQLPWVGHVYSTVSAVALAIFGLAIGYKAFTAYLMWSEGTADPDGSVMMKSILRVGIYMALSGSIALMTFQFGISFAATIMSSPMLSADQGFHSIAGNLMALPGSVIAAQLVLGAGLLIAVVFLLVVIVQMAVRGAELIIYYLAAPFVALGQLNAGGGIWNGWWTNLVILSLSQAVQMVCFVGLAGTTQFLTSPADSQWITTLLHASPIAAPIAIAASVGMTLVNAVLTLLMAFGWLIVAVRGPHLLKQWAYHSGVGGGAMYVGGVVGRNVGQSAGDKITAMGKGKGGGTG